MTGEVWLIMLHMECHLLEASKIIAMKFSYLANTCACVRLHNLILSSRCHSYFCWPDTILGKLFYMHGLAI